MHGRPALDSVAVCQPSRSTRSLADDLRSTRTKAVFVQDDSETYVKEMKQ